MGSLMGEIINKASRKKYNFLQGSGEMNTLVRSFDWFQTSLGNPDRWPESLRTMVSMLLGSKFPMLLWWGPDLIQIYNDAYRVSLGNNGKHPAALGQPAALCWTEAWPVIKPMIDRVLSTGEATWNEDQLVPIERNGRLEDVYWTYSYSPVRGASGSIEGILVVCYETTEKVKIIRKLRDSDQRFRNLIQDATIGIIVLHGTDLIIDIVNETFCKLIHERYEDIIEQRFIHVLPGIAEKFQDEIIQVMVTNQPLYLYEYGHDVFHSGKKVEGYLNLVFQPYKEADGTITTGVIILMHDVTDLVLARKKVEESEQRLRMVLTEAPSAIAILTGPEMRVEMFNEAMLRIWKRDGHIMGHSLLDYIPELKDQPFPEILSNVYRTGETYIANEELAFFSVDDKLVPGYFNYSYTALRNNKKEIIGILVIASDVTENVIARKQIEESERNFRNMILQAPAAMCILKGPSFIVEIANERMLELWGKSAKVLLNKPIFDGLPEVRNQGFESLLQKVYTTGEAFSANEVSIILPRASGLETVYINFVYEAFRGADDQITGIMVVANEVTDLVRAKQKIEDIVASRTNELAEVNRNLQESNSELAQFAYIASHDLQEPARKINTFTHMLASNLKDVDDRSKNYLDKIASSSTRMLTLIRDVLTFSQLGKLNLQFQLVDLNETLENVRNDFELLIEQKEACVINDVLPVIEGIPVQLSQLFSNLISNALKFTAKGREPVIRVTAEVFPQAEVKKHPLLMEDVLYYNIMFADNGIGFEQEHARHIFDIFQRLHGKSDFEGTGIGLAMCKKIAQNHHGDIHATGRLGKGAVFNVILPARIKR